MLINLIMGMEGRGLCLGGVGRECVGGACFYQGSGEGQSILHKMNRFSGLSSWQAGYAGS